MIDLTYLRCTAPTSPRLIGKSSVLTPIGAGVAQKLDWIGDKYAIDFVVPPMYIEPHGRQAIADLQAAQRQGARVLFPQVEFEAGPAGEPVAAAATGGTTLPITGGTPRYAIRRGQALSITRSGRSYLYFAAAVTILNSSGAGNVQLTVPLRTQLSGGEAVNLSAPIIEGWLDGDDRSWAYDESRTTSLAFTITERA